MPTKIFAAYPSNPSEIGQSFSLLDVDSNLGSSGIQFNSWEAHADAGNIIDTNILPHIENSDIVMTDITFPNCNVYFEAGYAIGLGKPVIPVVNEGLTKPSYLRTLGIFDNVVYKTYENHTDLKRIILENLNVSPLIFQDRKINKDQPVFVLTALRRTEFASKIVSSVKEHKMFFKSHDPAERYRLSFRDAFRAVDSSVGVVLSFLSESKEDWELHNIKASFLFGLSMGMNKKTLMLTDGVANIPLDFVDFVKSIKHPGEISEHVKEFSESIHLDRYKNSLTNFSASNGIKSVNLGSSAAENEFRTLKKYYVKTAAFKAALQGRARIMVGRKGSGKTAIFWRVRDILRQPKNNLVLDLKPEGYQLQKFKESSTKHLTKGTKSHVITAFWEYVILSELVRKIFEDDERFYGRDLELTKRLDDIREIYSSFGDSIEGDFSERLLHLINEVTENFSKTNSNNDGSPLQLTDAQITSLIYKSPIRNVHKSISDYLKRKNEVVVLIDNVDKGWGSTGIGTDDLIILHSLIAALERIQKLFVKSQVNFRWLLFLRNDVYELLLNNQSDRGKDERVLVDWEDKEALRSVINNRINYALTSGPQKTFADFAVPKVQGEDSLTWLIDRCVMRPRYLINLVDDCFGKATTANRRSISEDDILLAFKSSSIDMISDTNFEIRDVYPPAYDCIYILIGCPSQMQINELREILKSNLPAATLKECERLLYWFGVLGFKNQHGRSKFIYDFRYDEKIFTMHRQKAQLKNNFVIVNPAYTKGLECEMIM